VRDLVEGGWRAGGTVTFAATQAHRLGLHVGVVTRAASDFDVAAALGVADVIHHASETTTCFENMYGDGRRRQRVPSQAVAITSADVPPAWREAPVVLIGPVLGEVPDDLCGLFSDDSLVGVSAQGWLRRLDAARRVVARCWTGAAFWKGCDAVFVSDEDLDDCEALLRRWEREVPVVAMTEAWRGVRVHTDGAWRHIDAFPETEVDPTGAGDTFATAFLIRLRETRDVAQAARFGAAAASLSVAGDAAEAIGTRAQIEERLERNPDVVLR